MQRRDFLKYSVALGVASALPLWSRAVFAAERPTLPIPDLLTTDARNRIQLTIGAGQSTFGEKTATTWGYNGNLLGPAVKLQRGKAVTVDIYNQLTEETTLHWQSTRNTLPRVAGCACVCSMAVMPARSISPPATIARFM